MMYFLCVQWRNENSGEIERLLHAWICMFFYLGVYCFFGWNHTYKPIHFLNYLIKNYVSICIFLYFEAKNGKICAKNACFCHMKMLFWNMREQKMIRKMFCKLSNLDHENVQRPPMSITLLECWTDFSKCCSLALS